MKTNIYGKLHDHKQKFRRIDNAPISDQNKEHIKNYMKHMLLHESRHDSEEQVDEMMKQYNEND